jgi:hypothetical protein
MYSYNVDKNFIHHHTLIVCFISFLLLIFVPLNALAEFEKPGSLKAESLLAPDLLKGDHYTVNTQVKNDGLFNHYIVNSSFGNFKASSTSSLKMLIVEIGAIATMRQVETDDTAINSLKQSGQNTVTGVKNLVTHPGETLEGAASGVGSLFNRAKETVGSREVSDAEDNKVEQLVGFSKSKGQIATKYGVNVYSLNEVLQKELDRLAWADYFGGLGVGVATSAIPGAGGFILSTSGTARLLNEAINTTPASELWVQNKAKLLAMGINEDTVELFLNNHVFTPALTTVMTTALESMKKVGNRELALKVALQASTADMAKVITEIVVMTAGYNKHIEPITKLLLMARVMRAEKKDGTPVILVPTDHLIWSEHIAGVFSSLTSEMRQSNVKVKEIWVFGNLSSVAHHEIEKMGWKIHTGAKQQLLPSKK